MLNKMMVFQCYLIIRDKINNLWNAWTTPLGASEFQLEAVRGLFLKIFALFGPPEKLFCRFLKDSASCGMYQARFSAAPRAR
jgi:hypothetical protein